MLHGATVWNGCYSWEYGVTVGMTVLQLGVWCYNGEQGVRGWSIIFTMGRKVSAGMVLQWVVWRIGCFSGQHQMTIVECVFKRDYGVSLWSMVLKWRAVLQDVCYRAE